MAVEDGAVLGDIFAHLSDRSQIPHFLTLYEKFRKPRATKIVQKSSLARHDYHMEDGPEQEERDSILQNGVGFEDFPNPWGDPVFREWLFSYDSSDAAEQAWRDFSRSGYARL